jgi:molybdopterin converting factor small subunit
MKIDIEFTHQLRQACGLDSVQLELDGPVDSCQLVERLVRQRSELFEDLLLEDEQLRTGTLMFINQQHVPWNQPRALVDGDRVTFMSLISGG